jgi:arginine decarboxylase
MIFPTSKTYFLACGASEGSTELNAFDAALLQAGIGNTNLIKASSIIPPACREIAPVSLPFGAFVPVAYAWVARDQPGEVISAGIAIAFPKDETKPGLIMEHADQAGRKVTEEKVIQMAKEGMEVRGEPVQRIVSRAIEHRVASLGVAIAAVVLWT